jgi:hypothetical protein
MLVSISEGFCLEGLLGAILFSELDMLAAEAGLIEDCRLVVVESSTVALGILSCVVGLGGSKRGANSYVLHQLSEIRQAPTTEDHCRTYHPFIAISSCS